MRGDGSFVTAAVNGAISSFTAGGAVDTGFGTGGTTTISTAALHAVRVYPDGSVLAAGEGTGAATAKRLLVAKLGPGGTPSAGFGTAGVVRLLAGTGNNQGQALALQSDGRILIAGGAVTTGNVSAFAVARLTAAGQPDTTWSPSGAGHDTARRNRLRHGDRPVGERVRRLRAARRQLARQRVSSTSSSRATSAARRP